MTNWLRYFRGVAPQSYLLWAMAAMFLVTWANFQIHVPSSEQRVVRQLSNCSRLGRVGTQRDSALTRQLIKQWKKTKTGVRVISPKTGRGKEGFLSVGILTKSSNRSLILSTLNGLVRNTYSSEFGDVTVVVHLSAESEEKNLELLRAIVLTFTKYVENGFIHILGRDSRQLNYTNYAQFKGYESKKYGSRLKNDKKGAMSTEEKEKLLYNRDSATMFAYCRPLSKYYVHLHEGVIPSWSYIGDIQQTLQRYREKRWITIELSSRPDVGLLFRNSDLVKIARFLLMFQEKHNLGELLGIYEKITHGRPGSPNLAKSRSPVFYNDMSEAPRHPHIYHVVSYIPYIFISITAVSIVLTVLYAVYMGETV